MTEKDFRKRLDKIRAAINIISDEMNMLYVEFSEFEKRATAPNSASTSCIGGDGLHAFNKQNQPSWKFCPLCGVKL